MACRACRTPKRIDAVGYSVRAREKAGIEKAAFQFRDLRAKAATDTDDAVGIEAARVLLGHTTQNMTKRYIRNRKGHLSEPAVKLNKNRQAT